MTFSADGDFAKQLDAEDPLRHFREKFHLPLGKDGKPGGEGEDADITSWESVRR